MARQLKDDYGIVYARGMVVTYYNPYGLEALKDLGIEVNTEYYIRTVRYGANGLKLDLFKEPEFKTFVGQFHSSWFGKPKFNTIAGNILYAK